MSHRKLYIPRNNASKSPVRRAEHFMNLIAVAQADGKITSSEKRFLVNYGLDCNMTMDVILMQIEYGRELSVIVPLNQESKYEQLNDAIDMALSDDDLDVSEYRVCLLLALKLDIPKGELDRLLIEKDPELELPDSLEGIDDLLSSI